MAPAKGKFGVTIRTAFNGASDDDLLTRAAAVAFYSALSMAPLIVLILWLLSLIRPQWQGQLNAALSTMMGDNAAQAIMLVIKNAKSRPEMGHIAGIISIFVTLFSASAVFAQLQSTLNIIWRVQDRPHDTINRWLKARARAFGLIVGIAFLLIISFAVSALIQFFIPDKSTAWSIVEYTVTLVVFMVAFGAMYRILPDAPIAWPDACWGALLTTVLFIAGKFAIDLYLKHASVGGAYGPAGGLVVMLTWVYYAAVVVLLGAELTHGLSVARGDIATPAVADQKVEDAANASAH